MWANVNPIHAWYMIILSWKWTLSWTWKSKSSEAFARAQSSGVPLKELSRVKLRQLTREHISNNILKSSKMHDYTRRAHVLHNVKKCNPWMFMYVNMRAKGNPMKAVREDAIILCFKRPKTKKVQKVIKRPAVFCNHNHSILGYVLCVLWCEASQILTGNSNNPK